MAEMIDIEALEAELSRRQAIDEELNVSLDKADLLNIVMNLIRKDGINFIEKCPNIVNKAMEMEDRRLQQLALLQPKALIDMNYMEMRTHLQENFLSSCINTAQTDKSAFLTLLERFAQDEAMKVALSSESYH